MSIQSAYDRWARSYDADPNATRDLDAEVTRSLHEGRRFGLVFEAGCGTGKNTPFFAARAERVVAVDLSAEMLALARAREGVANVAFLQHDLAARWPVPDGRCDLVTFNLVLEHVEHLGPIFAEARRACRLGGRVVISELHPIRQYGGSQARFTEGGVEELVPAFVHHVSDFVTAGERAGLRLVSLREWWHERDRGGLPRILTLELEAVGAGRVGPAVALEAPRPAPALALVDARSSAEARAWLEAVYPFYLHDLSEHAPTEYRLSATGTWEPDYLPYWLREPFCQPLVAVLDGRPVGFALVGEDPFPFKSPDVRARLAELFVLRAHRRAGVGRALAEAVLRRAQGPFELAVLAANAPALAFWRALLGGRRDLVERPDGDVVLFRFDAP